MTTFDKTGEIIIYQTTDGKTNLDVRLESETVWLTQMQIAELYGTQRPAITKHLGNIFRTGELDENSVSSILEHTANDKKVYHTKFYNLDAIISIGYRVNSRNATQFRIWANKVLKEYLVKGYAINEKIRLQQYDDLKQTVSINKDLVIAEFATTASSDYTNHAFHSVRNASSVEQKPSLRAQAFRWNARTLIYVAFLTECSCMEIIHFLPSYHS